MTGSLFRRPPLRPVCRTDLRLRSSRGFRPSALRLSTASTGPDRQLRDTDPRKIADQKAPTFGAFFALLPSCMVSSSRPLFCPVTATPIAHSRNMRTGRGLAAPALPKKLYSTLALMGGLPLQRGLLVPPSSCPLSRIPPDAAAPTVWWQCNVSAACPMLRDCVNCLMPNSIFRCPTTGLNVPRPFVPDPDADPNFYEHLPCPACGQSHLMHKSTGELIGEPHEE